MSGEQESFMSHLVELRQRLMRAVGAVGVLFVVFAFAWPGAGTIYDFLAVPLMSALPQGAKTTSAPSRRMRWTLRAWRRTSSLPM